MTPPTLTLPPPAETLWQAIGETVREELRSISDGHTQYAIGGGSILAARWKHRESYDIDLVVQPDTPLGMLAEANNPAAQFEARMRTLGGKPAFFPMARLWTVSFDEGERKLDLWATAPLLGAGQQACTIDGRLETALSSAQVRDSSAAQNPCDSGFVSTRRRGEPPESRLRGRPEVERDMVPMVAVKGVSAGDPIAYALRSVRIATPCSEPANSRSERRGPSAAPRAQSWR